MTTIDKKVEKKFQIIQVGAAHMSPEYRAKLEADGYELIKTLLGVDDKPAIYKFQLKAKDTNGHN